MKSILIFIILTITVTEVLSNIMVNSPKSLVNQLLKMNKMEENIESTVGNFGELPFGKTIKGFVFLSGPDHDWCDGTIYNYINETLIDFVPIVIANDKNCPFTKKAQLAQKAKASGLIIYSSTQSFDNPENHDDLEFGSNISIPTIIIKNDSGSAIINAINDLRNTNSNEKVIVTLSFKSLGSVEDKVEIGLFFRSDQVQSLHFFKEFYDYLKEISESVSITPYYKYTKCIICNSLANHEEKDESEEGCIGDYCGSFNPSLKIENGKLIALENLRQKCIFKNHKLTDYWQYMMSFSEKCANLDRPNFTSDCSSSIISTLSLKSNEIEKCIIESSKTVNNKDIIENENNLIISDYDSYREYKVSRIPTIEINGIKYKGSWYGKHVFHSICLYFESKEACESIMKNEITVVPANNSYSIGVIIIIVVSVVVLLIIIAICYKRYVNKLIESSIEERIFKQTEHSIGMYTKMGKDKLETN